MPVHEPALLAVVPPVLADAVDPPAPALALEAVLPPLELVAPEPAFAPPLEPDVPVAVAGFDEPLPLEPPPVVVFVEPPAPVEVAGLPAVTVLVDVPLLPELLHAPARLRRHANPLENCRA
jgi:hypothetical protein